MHTATTIAISISIILIAVLASIKVANADVEQNSVSLYTWPGGCTSPPCILVVPVNDTGHVEVKYVLNVETEVAALPRKAPPCKGGNLVILDAYHLGRPVEGGLVIVHDKVKGGYCSARLTSLGRAYFNLDPGIYKVYVLSGRSRMGYKLIGEANLTFWCPCSQPYLRVDLSSLEHLLGAENARARYSIRLEAPVFAGNAIMPVPYLEPATWNIDGSTVGLPCLANVKFKTIYHIGVLIELAGKTLHTNYTISQPYAVSEPSASVILFPVAGKPIATIAPGISNVTVAAFTCVETKPRIVYRVNESSWVYADAEPDRASILYSEAVKKLENAVEYIADSLGSALGRDIDPKVKVFWFYAGHVQLALPKPGTVIEYRAEVGHSNDTDTWSPAAIVIAVNPHGANALVYEPALAAWLAKTLQRGQDIPEPLAAHYKASYKVIELFRSHPLLGVVQRPRWETLASKFNMTIAVTPREAATLLHVSRPRLIVIGDAALIYSDELPSLLYGIESYVLSHRGVGVIAFHAAIAGLYFEPTTGRLVGYKPSRLWRLLGLTGLTFYPIEKPLVVPWVACPAGSKQLCSIGWQLAAPWLLRRSQAVALREAASHQQLPAGYQEALQRLAHLIEELYVNASRGEGLELRNGWPSLLYRLLVRQALNATCSSDMLRCIVFYDGYRLGRGYRAVYVSYTLERLRGREQCATLAGLAEWVLTRPSVRHGPPVPEGAGKLLYLSALLLQGYKRQGIYVLHGYGHVYVLVVAKGVVEVSLEAPRGLQRVCLEDSLSLYRSRTATAGALILHLDYRAEELSIVLVAIYGREYLPPPRGLTKLIRRPVVGTLLLHGIWLV